MTTYSELIASIERSGDGACSVHVPAEWMQGRTTYGGLTAALCLKAARPLAEGKPLRSAQIAFIGPVGGDVTFTASVLRMGKSSAFIGADLFGADGSIAARATFVFGSTRTGGQNVPPRLPVPDVPTPDKIPGLMPKGVGPSFIQNFEILLARGELPFSGGDMGDNLLWMRHRDPNVQNAVTSLMALGDAPPPAAMSMFSVPTMISSMNWSIDVLTETFETEDRWWLGRTTAETLANGYSAQSMAMWNTDGEPVMVSRQTVAVFAQNIA